MSDDKVGTIERDDRGNVTIFAPAAVVRAAAPMPQSSQSRQPAEEPPSRILMRVIRHINGLAVALEALRLKLEAQERKTKE